MAEEQQQKEARDFANSPAGEIVGSYRTYILVKRCYEMRKGYLAVLISDQEIAQARDAVSLIEKKLAPQLDPHFTLEKLWEDSDRAIDAQYGSLLNACQMESHHCRPLCQQALSELLAGRARIIPGSAETKKDF